MLPSLKSKQRKSVESWIQVVLLLCVEYSWLLCEVVILVSILEKLEFLILDQILFFKHLNQSDNVSANWLSLENVALVFDLIWI